MYGEGRPCSARLGVPVPTVVEHSGALRICVVEPLQPSWPRGIPWAHVAGPFCVTGPARPSRILLYSVASACGRVARCLRWGLRARWEGASS